jgi:hypothetical protein
MLNPWAERPQDVFNLLNPAFVGAILHRAVSGFNETSKAGMPFEQMVLVPPLVLHRKTRERLPTGIASVFASWVQDNRDVLVEFAPRVESLLPYTRESIMFLLSHEMAVVDTTSCFRTTDKQMKGRTKYSGISEEIHECWLRSHFIGRWLAGAGTSATIYTLLGIRP